MASKALGGALGAFLAIGGCTTPATTLRAPSGQIAVCGGNVSSSLAGGMIGYAIQKDADRDCVRTYTGLGFVPVGTAP